VRKTTDLASYQMQQSGQLEYSECSDHGRVLVIIIHHEQGLNGPVSASYNNLFKGLPSRFRPIGSEVHSITSRTQLSP